MNKELKDEFESEKQALLTQIFATLKDIYQEKVGEQTNFDLSCVETSDEKASFVAECEKMGLKMPKLTQFLEDVAFSEMIKELL